MVETPALLEHVNALDGSESPYVVSYNIKADVDPGGN
jgi:hypothetical protein